MPYCEPHRTARDRIIDLEIMKLELRKRAHPPAPEPSPASAAAAERIEIGRRLAAR